MTNTINTFKHAVAGGLGAFVAGKYVAPTVDKKIREIAEVVHDVAKTLKVTEKCENFAKQHPATMIGAHANGPILLIGMLALKPGIVMGGGIALGLGLGIDHCIHKGKGSHSVQENTSFQENDVGNNSVQENTSFQENKYVQEKHSLFSETKSWKCTIF